MLAITPQMKILVATEPADFRKAIDGLVRLCQQTLQQDPFSGTVFCFRNRRSTAIKILVYDGQGFWLCQKRLSCGKFSWWPAANAPAPARRREKLTRFLHVAGAPLDNNLCERALKKVILVR